MSKVIKILVFIVVVALLGWYIWSLVTHKKSLTQDNVLHLWIAPAQDQENYWAEAVKAWNESGQGMKVKFKTIPAAQSSEEAIL